MSTAVLVAATLAGCSSPDSSPTSGSGDSPEGKTLTLAHESPWNIEGTPMEFAVEKLKEDGYNVEVTYFDTPEALSQAVASGEVDAGVTSAGTVFSAIDAGAPLKNFLGLSRPNYVMVAKKDLDTCESLEGKRLAIHSQEGTTGTLTDKWLSEVCPDTKPDIFVLPGSENRIAGLIADQVDASPVDVISSMLLIDQYPDDFGLIDGYGDPDVMADYLFGNTDFLANEPEMAQDLVDAYMVGFDKVNSDPEAAEDLAVSLLPDLDPDIVREAVKYWIDEGMWSPVDGMDDDVVQSTIDLYALTTPYTNVKKPADVIDDQFMNSVNG
ncbi:ABC transporter substrate-binding protein [Compostimonas suwonensis]|uniref:ABC transporter substrate-binding protein n=1 Tax=Compostimonas suwonensis TaxID=1048394 RepID=UPI0012FD7581|nr:ABC transporter substrate-binding protein [Compostimonas suwonensis]